ncbi:MAG: DNA replication/repair protein RecF [Alphaproteobacteria bacterium]|nr:DNA replication/repair protein RecF [Alphaproteobacteria bacterium]
MRTGIQELRLKHFRSYESLSLKMGTDLLPVVLSGGNGAGKTNILEAISFLVPGRGLRQSKLSDIALKTPEQMRSMGNDDIDCSWSVSALVQTNNALVRIGTGVLAEGEKRQIRIDGENLKTQKELGNFLSAIWITPAQDKLFSGDPSARRRFLDRLVQAFDAGHTSVCSDYAYALKQWNNLLHEGRSNPVWLSVLEEQIAANGVAIAAARRDIVTRLQRFLQERQVDGFPTPIINLTGMVEQWLEGLPAIDVEDKYREKLKASRHLVADGGSVCGVHTSDFSVMHAQKGMDASECSTGEQKALLYSIVLAQAKAATQEKGQCPVLLFDELAAHFDAGRRTALLERLLALPTQVWMTGTEKEPFLSLNGRAEFFNVDNAKVELEKVA